MSITIKLSPSFYEYADNREAVEVEGATVRECLDDLIARFPVFKDLVSDSEHPLSVLIIYDGEVIVPSRLDRLVTDHSEMTLMPMIYGG